MKIFINIIYYIFRQGNFPVQDPCLQMFKCVNTRLFLSSIEVYWRPTMEKDVGYGIIKFYQYVSTIHSLQDIVTVNIKGYFSHFKTYGLGIGHHNSQLKIRKKIGEPVSTNIIISFVLRVLFFTRSCMNNSLCSQKLWILFYVAI